MKALRDIIQRCHKQHNAALRQRRTVVTPVLHRDYPYHFIVRCGRGFPVRLYDLEQANISFMPIGHAPEADHPPKDFGGERFLKQQRTRDWIPRRWFVSWGIQIYTGTPSGRDAAHWHDFDFKYEAIAAAPDAVLACIEMLVNAVTNPLLTLTKSGGLRLSCRVVDYLHPNTDPAKAYIHKHIPTADNLYHRDLYLEILGERGHSRWDTRYEILLGNLLDPPITTKEILFTPINTLRDALHEPTPASEDNSKPVVQETPAVPPVAAPVDEKVVSIRAGQTQSIGDKTSKSGAIQVGIRWYGARRFYFAGSRIRRKNGMALCRRRNRCPAPLYRNPYIERRIRCMECQPARECFTGLCESFTECFGEQKRTL